MYLHSSSHLLRHKSDSVFRAEHMIAWIHVLEIKTTTFISDLQKQECFYLDKRSPFPQMSDKKCMKFESLCAWQITVLWKYIQWYEDIKTHCQISQKLESLTNIVTINQITSRFGQKSFVTLWLTKKCSGPAIFVGIRNYVTIGPENLQLLSTFVSLRLS